MSAEVGASADFDVRAANMAWLELNDAQYDRYSQLMAANMSAWPKELWDFVQADVKEYSYSGEVVSVAVANWVKAQDKS